MACPNWSSSLASYVAEPACAERRRPGDAYAGNLLRDDDRDLPDGGIARGVGDSHLEFIGAGDEEGRHRALGRGRLVVAEAGRGAAGAETVVHS